MTKHAALLDMPELEPGITRFWLIRHAVVAQNARMVVYGSTDVPLCPESLVAQSAMYAALAARLPHTQSWYTSPLSRTQETARAIQHAGYPGTEWKVEADLIEQNMGEWHGLAHAELPSRLKLPAHVFWSVSATETPPGGESMQQVCTRVGAALERLADRHDGEDIVAVSHGGAIRAAVAHALEVEAEAALRFSVQNLALTIIERHPGCWRIVAVNEVPGV